MKVRSPILCFGVFALLISSGKFRIMSVFLLLTLPLLYCVGVVLIWWFFKDELSSTQLSPNSITASASCLPED